MFISISGETAVVQLRHGRRIFRANCVNPVTESTLGDTDEDESLNEIVDQEDDRTSVKETSNEISMTDTSTPQAMNAEVKNEDESLRHKSLRKVKPTKGKANPEFTQIRQNEINGLLREGTFERTNRSEIPKGTKVFGTRFY